MDGFLVVLVRAIISRTKSYHYHDWVSIQKIKRLSECLQELLISPVRLVSNKSCMLLEVEKVAIFLDPFQEWLIVVVVVPLQVKVWCTFIGAGGHNYFLYQARNEDKVMPGRCLRKFADHWLGPL
jgi:hypothetical protein